MSNSTTKVCPVCGKQIIYSSTQPHQIYCSRECRFLHDRKRGKRKCAGCGNQFEQIRARDKYCSKQCAHKHMPRLKRRARKKCICGWCKREFETWNSCPGRFCSGSCRGKFIGAMRRLNPRGKWLYRACVLCGKIYKVHECNAIRGSKYCSSECKNKGHGLSLRGSRNPHYRGGKIRRRGPNWQAQSRAARERDGNTCQICGKKQKKGRRWQMGVHHITPWREFNGDWESANQLTNLITLCRSCHTKVEFGHLPCPVRLF